jgi:hypothetical protein
MKEKNKEETMRSMKSRKTMLWKTMMSNKISLILLPILLRRNQNYLKYRKKWRRGTRNKNIKIKVLNKQCLKIEQK